MKVKHNVEIIVGDYQFADSLNKEVLHQLQFAEDIGHTNVKAFHTIWNWLPNNQKIKNFKSFILSEIEKKYQPGAQVHGIRCVGKITTLWANVRPKEGRYIIFPSYLIHSVPKHRSKHERVTLSGNYLLNR